MPTMDKISCGILWNKLDHPLVKEFWNPSLPKHFLSHPIKTISNGIPHNFVTLARKVIHPKWFAIFNSRTCKKTLHVGIALLSSHFGGDYPPTLIFVIRRLVWTRVGTKISWKCITNMFLISLWFSTNAPLNCRNPKDIFNGVVLFQEVKVELWGFISLHHPMQASLYSHNTYLTILFTMIEVLKL